MTRPLADILSTDRYNEDETSHNGDDFDRGYRRGWNHAMRHVGRELGVVVSAAPVSTTEIAAPPAIDGNPSLGTDAAPFIKALLAQLDEIGGYCTPQQQAERRAARAYVEEIKK